MFQRKLHSVQGLREIFSLSIESSNANKFAEIQCILNYTMNVCSRLYTKKLSGIKLGLHLSSFLPRQFMQQITVLCLNVSF